VIAGVLIRRTVPAMAATLVGFAAVQLAWPIWVRQHLIAPVHTVVALMPANVFGIREVNSSVSFEAVPNFSQQGAWVLSSQVVNKSGHPFHGSAPSYCFDDNAWLIHRRGA
jgi:hypothetical protein